MSRPKFLVADLLCGAGGSSTGCKRALDKLGLEMELVCVNHWGVAIATHQLNHPHARHYVQDIATVQPHLLVPEGYLDLLMASPSCVSFSPASAGRRKSDQQRSDPWHILPWLTQLRVKRLIIENVWEFLKWGPVDEVTGKPIKEREGEYFEVWREAIERLGHTLELKKLNAANFGAATTRSRLIMMGRSDGRRIIWPAHTHARNPDPVKEPHLKPWRAAREIIDPTLRGRSIFNRKKPLAEKTIARIYAGAVKHGWDEAFLVILRNHMSTRGMTVPVPTLTAGGQHIAVAQPVLINLKKGAAARTLDETVPTLTAEASHVAVAEPLVISQHSTGVARPTKEPLPTIMTGGAGAARRRGCARPALVEAFILPQEAGGVTRSKNEPLPTIATKGAHALIAPYYGDGSGLSCTSSNEPLPTASTKARFGLVLPVTQGNGGARARSLNEPVPTMTTSKRGEFAMVMPLTHHDGSMRSRDAKVEPVPTVTGANRGELAIVTGHDGEPGDQSAAKDVAPQAAFQGDLLIGPDGRTYDIELRMMSVGELSAAMGLVGDTGPYRFVGTKTDQIKQIGNAVSVEKMEACVLALAADAAPDFATGDSDRLAA
jgi:DNA (cytosine-5)-methyltransferase 1